MKILEWLKEKKLIVTPLLLITIFISIAIPAIKNKSRTTDESSHMIRGVMLLTTGDYRLNQHHPFLFNAINAIPAVLNPDLKTENLDSENWKYAKKDSMGSKLIEINGGNKSFSENILYGSRLSMIFISAAFIGVFFYIVYKEWGYTASVLATSLMALNPTYIAHSSIVTTDIPALITMFLASFALYKFVQSKPKLRNKRFWIFALLSGIALISKYTATLLAFLWLIVVFIHGLRSVKSNKILNAVKYSSLTVLAWLMILFISYGFQLNTMHYADYGNEEKIENITSHFKNMGKRIDKVIGIDPGPPLTYFYEKVPVPAPQYFKGFYDNVFKHNYYGHSSYFLGDFSNGGKILYFPVAYLSKEPIPSLLMLFISIGFVIYNRKKVKGGIKRNLVLVAIPLFLLALSMSSQLNLGIRHILPIYPFIFLFIGISISKLMKHRDKFKYLYLLIPLQLISLIFASPDYLSYFNEAVGGGDNGYKIVRDSNLDWGQNNVLVEEYKKNNPEDIVIKVETLYGRPEGMSDETKEIRNRYESGELELKEILYNTHWVFQETN